MKQRSIENREILEIDKKRLEKTDDKLLYGEKVDFHYFPHFYDHKYIK